MTGAEPVTPFSTALTRVLPGTSAATYEPRWSRSIDAIVLFEENQKTDARERAIDHGDRDERAEPLE
jgi:hypothetical protein